MPSPIHDTRIFQVIHPMHMKIAVTMSANMMTLRARIRSSQPLFSEEFHGRGHIVIRGWGGGGLHSVGFVPPSNTGVHGTPLSQAYALHSPHASMRTGSWTSHGGGPSIQVSAAHQNSDDPISDPGEVTTVVVLLLRTQGSSWRLSLFVHAGATPPRPVREDGGGPGRRRRHCDNP